MLDEKRHCQGFCLFSLQNTGAVSKLSLSFQQVSTMQHVNNMLYAIRLVDILNSHTDYILCQQQRWIYFFPYPILLSLLLACKFVFGISLAFEKQLQFSLAQGSPCLLAKIDTEANRNKHKQMISCVLILATIINARIVVLSR